MRIVTLCEDKILKNSKLKSIHGLSLYIQVKGHTYLYDVGQGRIFLENAKILGVDLNECEKIIISHGHYDHGKGLKEIKDKLDESNFIINRKAFKERVRVNEDKSVKQIGILESCASLEKMSLDIKESFEINDGIWAICNVNIPENYERTDKGLYTLDENKKYIPDDFEDELNLVIETKKGLVVISGCSHCGVINILNEAKKVTGVDKIAMFIGGMHLVKASRESILDVAKNLIDLKVEKLLIGHCTGEDAISLLKEKIGDRVQIINNYVGYEFIDDELN